MGLYNMFRIPPITAYRLLYLRLIESGIYLPHRKFAFSPQLQRVEVSLPVSSFSFAFLINFDRASRSDPLIKVSAFLRSRFRKRTKEILSIDLPEQLSCTHGRRTTGPHVARSNSMNDVRFCGVSFPEVITTSSVDGPNSAPQGGVRCGYLSVL